VFINPTEQGGAAAIQKHTGRVTTHFGTWNLKLENLNFCAWNLSDRPALLSFRTLTLRL